MPPRGSQPGVESPSRPDPGRDDPRGHDPPPAGAPATDGPAEASASGMPAVDARISRILRTDYLAFYLLVFALAASCLVLVAFGALRGLRGGAWPGTDGTARSWFEVLWMGLGAALLHVAVTLPVVAWRVQRWRRVLLRGRVVAGTLEAVRRRGRDLVAVRYRYPAGGLERSRTLLVRAVPELGRLLTADHRILVLPGKPRRALPAALFLPRAPELRSSPGRPPGHPPGPGTGGKPPHREENPP